MLSLRLCGMVLMMATVMTTLANEATIKVNARERGIPISPVLWGIFFEEINHAGDGGLYAELVRNRSFEDADTPEAWTLLPSNRDSQIAIDTRQPLHPNTPRSLRWEIGAGEGPALLANDGYWGIAVRKGKSYRLTFYARCAPAFRGTLTVSLQSQSGKVYAQKTVRGLGTEWKPFQTLLRSQANDPQARLVLSVDTPGVLWLDGVSLMPVDTFKRRPNGLRADLAQMLAELRPSFVRFPGGCFVEGNTMASALRWRNTVGDWIERPTRWCLWGYHSTQGLGLLEYLQMSEDLGAEPMLVVNCGMACQYRTTEAAPLEQLDEWIEDALFAIEYAIGDPTTPAGALRAKHGR
ncbi:MAG: alpha-N-arabinofuranosidase, partial [Fimbriimonadales bacterium]